MVLGESNSPGWHAHVMGGAGLGAPQLVDGYANGWRVTPAKDAFDIAIEWTPQRQVWAALWISLVAALACIAIVALTWRRRVTAFATLEDADVALAWIAPRATATRSRWIAPLIGGVLAAIAVTPWAGVL